MDNIKSATNQFSRVSPSQSGSKQRDEGFIASSRAESSTSKRDLATRSSSANQTQSQQASDISDRRSNVLVEQRKQDLAKQVSANENAQQQTDKFEELNAQRQLEARAAANKKKINDSYSSVQQSSNQRQADVERTEQTETTNTHQTANPEPINLVV